MDQLFSQYFCIFCHKTFDAEVNEAIDHYKEHMKFSYYCEKCDSKVGRKLDDETETEIENDKCTVNHQFENVKINEIERNTIDIWIERFLTFQGELRFKKYKSLLVESKYFKGCPVCDSLNRIYIQETNSMKTYSELDTMVQGSMKTHLSRHTNAHLRYYPYECYCCEQMGNYSKKTDISEMSRHMKNTHGNLLKNYQTANMIKKVKITKLERFLEYYLKSINNNITDSISSKLNRLKTNSNSNLMINSNTSSSSSNNNNDVTLRNGNEITGLNNEITGLNNDVTGLTDEVTGLTDEVTGLTDEVTGLTDFISTMNKKIKLDFSMLGSHIKTKKSQDQSPKSTSTGKSPVEVIEIDIDEINRPRRMTRNQLANCKIVDYYEDKNKNKNISTVQTIKNVQNFKNVNFEQPSTSKYDEAANFRHIFEDEHGNIMMVNHDEKIDVEYFCAFCKEKFLGKDIAYRHYQVHLEYYPIVCQVCRDGFTDMEQYVDHHKRQHPKILNGRYKKIQNPIVDKWISGFLYSQATSIVRSFPAREQCPVCEIVFTKEEIKAQKPRRCTINRRIDHVHRHLCYLPYECIKCKENNCTFYVAYFESKAHSHIKQRHPEIDDNEYRWEIFQRAISIPKLDEFVKNYFAKFMISMEFERRPIKKKPLLQQQNKMPTELSLVSLTSASNSTEFELNEINPNLFNMVLSEVIDLNEDGSVLEFAENNEVELIIPNQSEASEYEDENEDDQSDKSFVVDAYPSEVPYIPKQTKLFFCVFCISKFQTKTEAYHHYGKHFGYFPITCKICREKFSDIESVMEHYHLNHPEESEIKYENAEDESLMKWVDDFLEFQINPKSKYTIIDCACNQCCPVCLRLNNSQFSIQSPSCHDHNDISFSDHLHQHLLYFPYECSICRKEKGRLVRVPNLDTSAMNHVKEHNILNATMYQLCKTFPKTLVIPKLEKFIGEQVHQKRIFDKRYNPSKQHFQYLQQQQKQHQQKELQQYIEQQQKEIQQLKDQLAQQQNVESPKTDNGNSKKSIHARIENGRVINLPPRFYERKT